MRINPNKAWIEHTEDAKGKESTYRLVVLSTTVLRSEELWEVLAECESLFGEGAEVRTWNVRDAVEAGWTDVSSWLRENAPTE